MFTISGEYDDLLTLVKKWKLRLKVFWLSKEDPTGHREREIIKEEEVDRIRGGKRILKSGQEWTLPAQLGQLKTKEIVAKSSMEPRRPSRIIGYNRIVSLPQTGGHKH